MRILNILNKQKINYEVQYAWEDVFILLKNKVLIIIRPQKNPFLTYKWKVALRISDFKRIEAIEDLLKQNKIRYQVDNEINLKTNNR